MRAAPERTRAKRAWSAGLAALLLAAPRTSLPAGTQDDGRGWRWKELELDVWIESDLGRAHVEGAGTLVLEADASAGPVLEINGKLFELAAVGAPGATVEIGERFEGTHRIALARLRFAAPRQRGDETRIDFAYDGAASSDQFAITARAALASWVEAWYPLPYGGPDAALSRLMAAPGTTRLHLPEGWRSVSNGEPVPAAEDDVEAWRVELPVARSFACAPYTRVELEVDGRPVAVHRLRSASEPADVELRAIADILRALEARYGPYPYPGYRVAEVPLGVGDFLGSSEQGFIMVRPVAFDAPDGNLALFAHELAHGWWGNLVSANGSGSMLLGEGLAQFSAVVAIEAIEGEAGATGFLRFSRPGYVGEQCARGYFGTWRAGRDRSLSQLGEGDGAHQLVDSKGHWVFHMLRERVGDERFFATLRGAIADFRTTPLTLAELRARFERAAPEAGLARFFADWLDRPGAPVLDLEWRAEGDAAHVAIRQLQEGEPYALLLEIAVDSAAGRRVHTLAVSERETRTVLAGEGPPTGVELDPRHRVLRWTPEYGERPGKSR